MVKLPVRKPNTRLRTDFNGYQMPDDGLTASENSFVQILIRRLLPSVLML